MNTETRPTNYELHSFVEKDKELLRDMGRREQAAQAPTQPVAAGPEQTDGEEARKGEPNKGRAGKGLRNRVVEILQPILRGPTGIAPAGVADTTVFAAEMAHISQRRNPNGRAVIEARTPSVKHDLTGVALSGGGVRSAAFCLGALQGLYHVAGKSKAAPTTGAGNTPEAPTSDLACIDYLSTVSGGGYTGTCLSLGMAQSDGRFPFGDPRQDAGETPVLQHLRDNSRYLLHGGVGGILSFVLVYLRGVVAGFLCLAPACLVFASILLLWLNDLKGLHSPPGFSLLASYEESYLPISKICGLVLMGILAFFAVLVSFQRSDAVSTRRKRAAIVVWCIGLPLLSLVFLEVHAALLRTYLVSAQAMAAPAVPENKTSMISLGKLIEAVKFLMPGLVAVVIAALPFIQKLALSAATKLDTGKATPIKAVLSKAALFLLSAVMPLLIWLAVMALVLTGLISGSGYLWGLTCLALALVLLAVGLWGIDINANSLHQIYRDRMSRAFLVSEPVIEMPEGAARIRKLDDIDSTRMSELGKPTAPYHILNTTLNLPGSAWANRRGRNAEFFMYSPLFVGSALTGYISTKAAEDTVKTFNLGTAMAVSGAAVAPNMGMGTIAPLSFTLALLNLRLGRWAINPRQINRIAQGKDRWTSLDRWPDMRHFLYEAFSKTGFKITPPPAPNSQAEAAAASGGDDPYVFLSDGGHIENLGVFELLRRRCRLIIAVDGECDPSVSCGALAQLERLARIDLGIKLRFDTDLITRAHRRASEAMADDTKPPIPEELRCGPHVAAVLIEYPAENGDTVPGYGTLLYVKSSLSGDENSYITAYKRKHAAFPHETTGDQFFTEEQFEVYRALGEHALRRALRGQDPVCDAQPDLKAEERAGLNAALKLLPGHSIRFTGEKNEPQAVPQPTSPSLPLVLPEQKKALQKRPARQRAGKGKLASNNPARQSSTVKAGS